VSSEKTLIEKIPADIGEAQGLLWAFDSLYVVVNKGGKYDSGLYRVTDKDGDDVLESVEQLRQLAGGAGEHGPHAVLLTPDGQNLYVVIGNQTKMTEISASRVPQIWDEDKLLPRIYGRGFMRGVSPPGGIIYQVDRDGKNWEVIASGFRNEFDAAVNGAGDLFTYDADMEWDMNCPWYRPTRICQVVSGTDWGWRNGSAKWPVYYPETLDPVVNVGPGSPTGVTFGYGTKFPAKYQNALFINDWSYGKMYAVHMTRKGAGYTGVLEEFVTGVPLPLTDVVVHPDGALYFAIGGRRVQSGLYRVTYVGPESTEPAPLKESVPPEVDTSQEPRGLTIKPDPKGVDLAWEFPGPQGPAGAGSRPNRAGASTRRAVAGPGSGRRQSPQVAGGVAGPGANAQTQLRPRRSGSGYAAAGLPGARRIAASARRSDARGDGPDRLVRAVTSKSRWNSSAYCM
jgi:hypothetical protein